MLYGKKKTSFFGGGGEQHKTHEQNLWAELKFLGVKFVERKVITYLLLTYSLHGAESF